jgi:hypothetical protein
MVTLAMDFLKHTLHRGPRLSVFEDPRALAKRSSERHYRYDPSINTTLAVPESEGWAQ